MIDILQTRLTKRDLLRLAAGMVGTIIAGGSLPANAAVRTFARPDLGLTDDEDPKGWVRVETPYNSPYPKFEYTAPMGTVKVEDGSGRFWIKRLHTPWKYTNWLPDYKPTADSRGLIQSYAPWTGNPATSGALAVYDELYSRVVGKPSYTRQKAAEMSAYARDNSPRSDVASLGLCDAGALATGKEIEPQSYRGHNLSISQEQSKSILIASYRHRAIVAPFVNIDPPLSREQILFNLNITRRLFREGKAVPVYNVTLDGQPGFWGRTQFSESEDGKTLEVTEFNSEFRLIGQSEIKWADMGEHPENSTVPVDWRLVRPLQEFNYGLDQRFVRHIIYGYELPTNFGS